jgi:phosphoenolpyruvate carboxykinase (ATP)
VIQKSVLGYSAKVAGTERGVKEPQATFSHCFGAPFMVHSPRVYADLLREKILKHNSHVYLVNTGWTGGPYGVGQRMKLRLTRQIISAIISNELANVEYNEPDPIFQLRTPKYVARYRSF